MMYVLGIMTGILISYMIYFLVKDNVTHIPKVSFKKKAEIISLKNPLDDIEL